MPWPPLRACHADCRSSLAMLRWTNVVVSGCMLTFGVTLTWVWWRGIGVFGLIYRAGDPFMAFFVCLGGALLLSGYVLASPGPRMAR